MKRRILDDLGAVKLSDVQRADVQAIADRMPAKNPDPSTIRNAIMPLRVVFRRALTRGEVAVSPTTGLEPPAVRGTRDRIVTPAEASTLIAALPELDRALWATAFYGGLRLGELRALKWTDIDLEANVIRVERGWDPAVGEIEAKSRAGRRTVPIAKVLREHLVAHRLRSGRVHGYVFGRSADRPFNPTSIYGRAARTWKKLNEKRIENELDAIESVGLHEARHAYA
jgi:integrase